MAHDVFISYSSKDKPTADAVCHALEAAGVRCWIAPRDIQPGADWGEAIIHGISGARVFVLVFSANANTSQQIKREVERAVNRGLPVIPFRIENVAPAASLEYFISTPHWLDAYSPPLEQHLHYLAETVEHLLGGAPKPVPPPAPVRKRIPRAQLAYVGALAAIVLAVIAWQLLPPSPAGSFATSRIEYSSERAQAAMQSQPLNALLISALKGSQAKVEMRNDPDGFYQLLMTAEDTGAVRFEDGELVFTSNSGAVERVNVERLDARIAAGSHRAEDGEVGVNMQGEATYPLNWLVRPAADPGRLLPVPLAGEWRAPEIFSPLSISAPWSGTMSISPSGQYTLRLRRAETGRYEIEKGRWRRSANFRGMPTPPGAFTDEASYKWRGRNEITLKNAEGAFTFRRVGPYRPLETDKAEADS